jgi:hypothetical protein
MNNIFLFVIVKESVTHIEPSLVLIELLLKAFLV